MRNFALFGLTVTGLVSLAACNGGSGHKNTASSGTSATTSRTTATVTSTTTATTTSASTAAATTSSNYLYVANTGDDTITTFALDPKTGAPSNPTDTQLVVPTTRMGASTFQVSTLVVDPTSSILFAAGYTTAAILRPTNPGAIEPIQIAKGMLTPGQWVQASNDPVTAVAIDPASDVVFTLNAGTTNTPGGITTAGGIMAFTYTNVTGIPTQQVSVSMGTAGPPTAAAIDSSGTFMYYVNPSDGKLGALGVDSGGFVVGPTFPITMTANPANVLVLDPKGEFVCTGNVDGTVALYAITAPGTTAAVGTGVSAEPAGSLLSASIQAIAIDPTGTYVVTANGPSDDVSLLVVTRGASGPSLALAGSPYALATPGVAGAATTPSAVVFNANGQVVYVANSGANNISALSVSRSGLTALPGSPFSLPANDTTPMSLAVSQ
jgi:6-phosphogluconolactonase (cycloisomerase 2 family)